MWTICLSCSTHFEEQIQNLPLEAVDVVVVGVEVAVETGFCSAVALERCSFEALISAV